ncbi:hypothetical protein PHMEG_00010157 [Phytophthora megakarya]|uniref:Uncharacterized protein n=1 Tax=Phytophthora megakarya TaxID=4795 RepID=A0A225WGF4_9STRA|nr:hypothetical protein PHMEG_00010157 [Phytophthora megakarya]
MSSSASPAPSTSINIPEDARPVASPPTSGGCSRALHRRFPLIHRVSMGLPSRAATVIAALLMVGIVGTFALHQMMSPEIEALTQQRETLKDEVLALRLQVDNMTRIADSRLETIHLLETELERQHVQAAEAAATVSPDRPGAVHDVTNLKSGDVVPNVLPTIFYTLILGSILLGAVLYRIFLIIRGEVGRQQKLGKQYVGNGLMMPSVSESAKNGRGTPPLSPTRGPIVDDSGRTATAANSLSPKASSEPSPQCYKRAPGSSPTIV